MEFRESIGVTQKIYNSKFVDKNTLDFFVRTSAQIEVFTFFREILRVSEVLRNYFNLTMTKSSLKFLCYVQTLEFWNSKFQIGNEILNNKSGKFWILFWLQ